MTIGNNKNGDLADIETKIDLIDTNVDTINTKTALNSTVAKAADLATLDAKVALDSTVAKAATVALDATVAKAADLATLDAKVALDSTVAKAATVALDATVAKAADHAVPAANSDANILIRDVIGNKTDLNVVPFADGDNSIMAHLQTGYYHVHGASFIYPDKAVPITLTSAIASWAETGAIVEIIPANGIIKNFDLHWCSISDISATLDGVIDIFAGPALSEVKIGSVDVVRTANFSRENAMPVQVPQQPANTRISARFTDSTASSRTVRIKLYGHVYATSLT